VDAPPAGVIKGFVMPATDMEKLVALCKRRGFIFQSSEIYGGIGGFWDYGPLGVELKRNVKDAWWNDMVRNPPPGPDGQEIAMVGLDSSIIMNPKIWEASGHVGGFSDPMVECNECKRRYRADKLWVAAFFDQSELYDELLAMAKAVDPESAEEKRAFPAELLPVLMQKQQPKLLLTLEVDSKEEADNFKLSKTQQKIFKGTPRVVSYPLLSAPAYLRRGCPSCVTGELGQPRQFNLMFETFVGALQDAASKAYLRPETAQGIFVNFKNVLDSTRLKLPFGIAQIGKAFRNEINPRNFTFRSREFEQMEIEFFCHPDESRKWYEYWRDVRLKWYTTLGIKSDRLRPREQGPKELAFYSVGTTDIEYLFPFADEPQELEGVAHRGDYDLTQHMKHSGKDLSYFEEELWAASDKSAYGGDKKKLEEAKKDRKYRYVPHVIEPSAGVDRFTLAALCEAYTEDVVDGEARTVMKFHPRLAPVKAAVFPLVNKDGMPEVAEKLYRELKAEFNVFYDDKGAVGRRYRRQDEAGTPFCFTIDGQTLQDQTVTLRDRDTTEQRRVPIAGVADELRRLLRPGT
jgi:glycyl-tRNA synthetase